MNVALMGTGAILAIIFFSFMWDFLKDGEEGPAALFTFFVVIGVVVLLIGTTLESKHVAYTHVIEKQYPVYNVYNIDDVTEDYVAFRAYVQGDENFFKERMVYNLTDGALRIYDNATGEWKTIP